MEINGAPGFQNLINNPDPLVHIGVLLLSGFFGGLVANHFKFPRVSGYILTGMILSPSVTGFFKADMVREDLSIITEIALGIIAFSIGGSLVMKSLKKLVGQILWINFAQALGAFFVSLILLSAIAPFLPIFEGGGRSFMSTILPMALIIASVSAATAPAAVMAIVHEFRAAGPLTTALLGVVALDDATAIILYSFAAVIAESLISSTDPSWGRMFINPLVSIGASIIIGLVGGVLFRKVARFVKRRDAMLGVVTGMVLIISGLTKSMDISPLMGNMVFGFVVVNFVDHAHDIFNVIEDVEEMLFSMFFTLAGAHLDISIFNFAGIILMLLIITGRFTGKFYGTRLGARISGAPEIVSKYMGLALLPKAGVTLGLILVGAEIFDDSLIATIMVNAVLGSVIINELIAPPLVKYAIVKSGESGRV